MLESLKFEERVFLTIFSSYRAFLFLFCCELREIIVKISHSV